MYETMAYGETAPNDESVPACVRDFTEMWQRAEKVVYSRSREAVSTARTRLEKRFDAREISALKKTAGRDRSVGGADKAWLPKGTHIDLELLDSHPFPSGFVSLGYRPAR
jgi:hypothetical protein